MQGICIRFVIITLLPTWIKRLITPLTGYMKCDWIRLLDYASQAGFKDLLRWNASSRKRLFYRDRVLKSSNETSALLQS